MKNVTLGVLAMATGLAIGGQVSAAILVATYTGTVSSGSDPLGLFGQAGGDLTGDPYVATYTIDTSKGIYENYLPDVDGLIGGEEISASSPISAIININGVNRYIGGNYEDLAVAAPYYVDQSYTYMMEYADNFDYQTSIIVFVSDLESYVDGISTASIFDTLPLTSAYTQGEADFASFDLDDDVEGPLTYAEFGSPGTVQISAVPEPATWATMLLGVFGLGAALRGARRRRLSALAGA